MGDETAIMKSRATDIVLSAGDAAELLKQYGRFRTLREKLSRYADPKDLRDRLVDGLAANHPEMKRESIERNVRNWMNDNAGQTIARRTVMEICFILHLDFESADELMALVTDERFRWRDPQECAMAFAIKSGMSYAEARALESRAAELMARRDDAGSDRVRTKDVQRDALACETAEELLAYIAANAERFGRERNTAFAFFERFMSILEEPEEVAQNTPRERRMTVREVLRDYLHRDLVPVAAKRNKREPEEAGITRAQRAAMAEIRANWPDESMISRMKNRSANVTRKTLILLFLATDGGGDGEYDPEVDDPDMELSREQLFEDSMMRMNLMLSACGFREIDPRNAFDWMIFYAMSVDATYEIDEKLDAILEAIFPLQNA